MFYKIIKNNKVIDVNYKLFAWDNKKKIMLMTNSLDNAQYIQSSNRSCFYLTRQLNGAPSEAPRLEVVDIEFIDAEEYSSLKEVLDSGEIIDIPTRDENIKQTTFEVQEERKVVTIKDLVIYIQDFERKYQNLLQEKSLLEECILELSQELYK